MLLSLQWPSLDNLNRAINLTVFWSSKFLMIMFSEMKRKMQGELSSGYLNKNVLDVNSIFQCTELKMK